jgi:ABC-type multidrug transport system fused ATPase/permease subunit
VLDGSVEEGAKLWSRLLHPDAENRATAGYFDLPKLVRILRPDFELRDYPDFEADWKRIKAVSMDNVRGVRSVIGNGTALARADEIQAVSKEITQHSVVVIAGESGSGKSALVSRLVAPGGASEPLAASHSAVFFRA